MVTYIINCEDCKVEYFTQQDETNCELCNSENIIKQEE